MQRFFLKFLPIWGLDISSEVKKIRKHSCFLTITFSFTYLKNAVWKSLSTYSYKSISAQLHISTQPYLYICYTYLSNHSVFYPVPSYSVTQVFTQFLCITEALSYSSLSHSLTHILLHHSHTLYSLSSHSFTCSQLSHSAHTHFTHILHNSFFQQLTT